MRNQTQVSCARGCSAVRLQPKWLLHAGGHTLSAPVALSEENGNALCDGLSGAKGLARAGRESAQCGSRDFTHPSAIFCHRDPIMRTHFNNVRKNKMQMQHVFFRRPYFKPLASASLYIVHITDARVLRVGAATGADADASVWAFAAYHRLPFACARSGTPAADHSIR